LEWIDWCLLSAIVGLSSFLLVQISEPLIYAWQNRPRPGVQVCREFASQEEGKNDAENVTLRLDYLLYLPQEYRK
jgi:hypothetical protein